MSEQLENIQVDRIQPGKSILRPLDSLKVDELSKSMKMNGQLQPILVRAVGDHFETIFGNHRLAAAKQIGLKTLACYVREATDAETFLMAEAENLQRNEFVDAVAEARGFRMLIEEGMTEKQIAERIGKTQQYVSGRLQLLRLETEIQAMITSRLVTPERPQALKGGG